MFRSKHLGLILPVIMVVTVLSSTSFGQKTRYMRWVGHGISDGYHVGTPGPNSDYYNPYTKHNSDLLIRSAKHSPVQTKNQRFPASSFSKYPRFSSPALRPSNRISVTRPPSPPATDNSLQPTLKKISTQSPARFRPAANSDKPKALDSGFSTLKPQSSPPSANPISIARALPAPNSNRDNLKSVVIGGGIK